MKIMVRRTMTVVALCLTLLVSVAQARIIEVHEAEKPPFNVVFEPKQKVYHAGEKIEFTFKTEKQCYLYLFSIDEDKDVGYMLLPNDLQQYHKYKANTPYTVPERTIEFTAGEPGVENVVMVASRKKLDLNFGSYVRFKDFHQAKADVMIKDLKALSVRPRQEKADMVIRETQIIVVGPDGVKPEPGDQVSDPAPTPPVSAEEAVVAFISADRTSYELGDTMKLSFGADAPGFVYLYLIEPKGKHTFMKKQEVDGKRFYQEKARVTKPSGEHVLVAVYDKEGDLDIGAFTPPSSAVKHKGLELIAEPQFYASYSFTVKE